MTHLLDRKDPWGQRMGLWVVVAMAMLLPPALWSLKSIHLNNDIKNWVPTDDPNVLTLDWYHDHFPSSESVLLTWQGSSLNDPRVNWLVDKLEGVPDADGLKHGGLKQVARVVTPQTLLRRVESDDVKIEDALDRLQGILVGTGPLKLELTKLGQSDTAATMAQLQTLIREQLKVEVATLPPFAEWQPEKPIEHYELAKHIVEPAVSQPFPAIAAHHGQLQWREMQPRVERTQRIIALAEGQTANNSERLVQRAFFSQGSPLSVAVVLSKRGEADVTETLKELRQMAQSVGIPAETLHLAGRPVANSELNQAVKRAAWDRTQPIWNLPGRSIILFSGAVGMLLAFLMLKSLRLTFVVLFGAYYTVLLAVALVGPTGGSMNMVLVVMPTLLLVTTMEAGIHVVSYWRYAAKHDPQNAVANAVKMATMPCLLASITGAFGLASLMTSSLRPVYDFGMYSAIGSLIGYVVTLYGLPPLLSYLPAKVALGPDDSQSSKFWERVAGTLVRRHGLVSLACVGIAAACSVGLIWFKTETKAIRYFPESSVVVKDYRFIEENIGGIVPVDIVVRFPEQTRAPADDGLLFAERQEIVRRIQNRLVQKHPDISGSISLATFRPTLSDEVLAQRKVSVFARKLDKTAEDKVLEEGSSARTFVTLAAETIVLSKVGRTLCEKNDELWRITAQVNIMTDSDYSVLTRDIADIVKAETSSNPEIGYVVTGMIPLFLETQQAILTSMIHSFWWAFLSIWLTLAIVLRSPIGGLIAMVPNALPVCVVFGLVSWMGIAIDVGTMITASVALGISVDATLHLLTWFRAGLEKGRTRRVAVAEALGHCGPALCQTGLVVGVGLLVLWPAELTLISRFGWLMAAMVAMALLGTLIWLPALLGGWFGTVIIAQQRKQMEKATALAIQAAAAATVAKGSTATPATVARLAVIDEENLAQHSNPGAPHFTPSINPVTTQI